VKGLLLIACLALCGCEGDDRTPRTIRDATVPARASTPSFDVVTRDGNTLRYAWQFTAPGDWKGYTEWVTGRLERQGFRRVRGERLAFSRYDGADHYQLDFTREESRVLVNLSIMPD
jgi:hypothetical protein